MSTLYAYTCILVPALLLYSHMYICVHVHVHVPAHAAAYVHVVMFWLVTL